MNELYLWTWCNVWHVCWIMYDLDCMLMVNRDPSWYSTDYRVYMCSSMTVGPLAGYHCTCALINGSVLLYFLFCLNLLLITLLFVVLYDILKYVFNNTDNQHSLDINEQSNRRIVEENFTASKPIGNKQNVDSTVPYNMNPRLQFFLFKCFVELIFFVEPFFAECKWIQRSN